MVDEQFGDSVALSLFVSDVADGRRVERDDVGSWYSDKDGGVSDYNVLRTLPSHLDDVGEMGQLTVRRQGCFWLVYDEDPSLREGIDKVQETLAVRLLMKGLLPIHGSPSFLVLDNSCGNIIETLRRFTNNRHGWRIDNLGIRLQD